MTGPCEEQNLTSVREEDLIKSATRLSVFHAVLCCLELENMVHLIIVQLVYAVYHSERDSGETQKVVAFLQ